jgi:predicted ATPase
MAIKINFKKKEITLDQKQEIIFRKLEKIRVFLEIEEIKKPQKFWQKIYKNFNKKDPKQIHSVYIHGEVGRGKSALMDNFYENIENNNKARFHFNYFMQQVHLNLNLIRKIELKDDNDIEQAISNVIGNIRVLCFDEFQVEDVADAMILKKSFSYLFKKNIIIIFTSNRHPQELYKNGLQRDSFLEFVNEILLPKCQIMNLDSNIDYRLLSKDSIDEYFFYPNNDENKKKFDKLIKEKVGKNELLVKKIKFLGREFVAKNATENIAVFTFSELFEDNLGASDYNQICQNFHTIFIRDIKQISPDHSEQAKRFILFVDEVYQYKAKIFCLSEVRIRSIYPKGKSSFIFKRTISRMMEFGKL